MTDILPVPYAQAAALALLHFLWQGSVLGLVAAAVLHFGRMSPTRRYGVGVATLAVMLAAPAITFVLLADRGVETPPAHADVTGFAGPGALSVVLGVWLLGVAGLTVRLLGGWTAARSLARRAIRPVAPDIQALADRVSHRLSVHGVVRVVESSIVLVPMVLGWLKPVVLLPTAVLSGLSPEQIEAILAHEFAHVRRYDYLVNLMQAAAETLLFFHPAVWWISRQIRVEREHCCDDLAIDVCGDGLVYARALAELATIATTPSFALAATDGSLLSRIERILNRSRPARVAAAGWVPVLFVTLLFAALLPVGSLSAKRQAALPFESVEVAATRADVPRDREIPAVYRVVNTGETHAALGTPEQSSLSDEERQQVEVQRQRLRDVIASDLSASTGDRPQDPDAITLRKLMLLRAMAEREAAAMGVRLSDSPLGVGGTGTDDEMRQRNRAVEIAAVQAAAGRRGGEPPSIKTPGGR